MKNQYGNYVAQWIIINGQKDDATLMLAKIPGQDLPLSENKFSVRESFTLSIFLPVPI